MDVGKDFNLMLLDALYAARRVWEQVGISTISHCLAEYNFIKEEIKTEEQDEELIELGSQARCEHYADAHSPEKTEKLETRCDACVRSARQLDVNYQPKEDALAGDSSELWTDT
ncbi:hypothetical protein RF11_15972 [Thelohanellus kitauei]|uniref:Uncharacterized protein n=1 Tax=Thelohanellus kitauei TaxID=669202 RepID=A0A0C2JBE0_THEKT|nr:hypothetical protein RF11_15972 [Thelohanellus kitauei]